MNTATVMPVQQPQAGAQTKAQGTAKAAKAGKASDKQSFGEAMEKLGQQGKEAGTASAGDTQESAADGGDVMEDVPQDPLAFVLAASQQENKAMQPAADILPQESEALQPATDILPQESEALQPAADILPQESEALQPAADVLSQDNESLPQESGLTEPSRTVSNEVQEQDQDVFAAQKETAQAAPARTADLQSLIPQSAEEGARNRNFLAMLAGQQLKPAAAQEKSAAEPAVTRPQQAATMLEAQLFSKQNPAGIVQVQAQESQPVMNVQVQAQESQPVMNVQVQAQFSEAAGQQAGQILASGSKEQQPEQGILAGINLSVEDETADVPLRMEAQQAGNQQNPQAGQQETARQELTGILTAKAQPLAEESASEQAPASGSNTSQLSGAVSMFQQTLQDSLTGTVGSKAAQAAPPQTDFDIPQQIVEQARLIRRAEDTQMVIKLNPEHLGELTLKVSVTQNGSVNASFHSDNAQVRAILENSLVQLRQELNDQGLKVDSVEVYAGLADGQLPQEQGQQAWQNQQGSHAGSSIRGLAADAEEYAEEADNLAAAASQGGTGKSATDGVDYRI